VRTTQPFVPGRPRENEDLRCRRFRLGRLIEREWPAVDRVVLTLGTIGKQPVYLVVGTGRLRR
jgi:hypothetical protein